MSMCVFMQNVARRSKRSTYRRYRAFNRRRVCLWGAQTQECLFTYTHLLYIYTHRARACYAIAIIIISINNMMIISNCNGIGSSILSYFSNDMRHATLALLTTTLWRLKHPSPEAARLLYSFPTFSKCHKLAGWQHDLRFFRNVCVYVCICVQCAW